MPKLIVQHQGQEWTVELKQGSNVVGRQSTCDIPIKEGQLSRQHCDIVLAGTTCIAVDKGSMNGTLVNGKRVVQQQPLQAGDKVAVGPVVLWYERKNQAAESAPPPAPVRDVERPASSGVATRRAVAADAPPMPGLDGARERSAALRKDYAVRARAGGNAGKIAGIVAALAALGVLGWLAKGFLDRPPAVKEDRGGLVRDGGFDNAEGKPAGWTLPEKPASALSIDSKQGRGAGACLAVEKASTAGDRLLVCAYAQDFPLGKNGAVNAEAQVRFETFTGWAALKIDWLREVRGPVVAEEFADAATKCSEWTALTASFTPPAGAGAFRLGLAFLGRGGRILVDDVSLRATAGGGPGREHKVGAHVVRPTGQGVLRITMPRLDFFDLQAQLETDKDGAVRQAAAQQVSLTPQENTLDFKGKLLSPIDFREIEYDQKVSLEGGGTTIAFRFKGEALRQIDRFSIVMTLPRGTGTPDPEAAVHPRSRMGFRTADGGFVLEYSVPALVASRGNVDGRHRIVQTFPIDAQEEEIIFGLRIREESAGGEADPQKAAQKALRERRFGEALSLLREFLRGVKEPGLRDKVEKEIRSIEDAEIREWTDVQASAFRAGLLRRPEIISRARDHVDAYLREWAGIAPSETKGSALRGEVAKIAPSTDAEGSRPARMLERGKAYAQAGKKALAAAVLETLVGSYPESDAAAAGRELLKALAP
ncbi:MAG TPA: FHA domain-containing protein [Planctomycetota bacterium]